MSDPECKETLRQLVAKRLGLSPGATPEAILEVLDQVVAVARTPELLVNEAILDGRVHVGSRQQCLQIAGGDYEVARLMLAGMHAPAFPVAMGVLFCDPAPSYESAVHEQIAEVAKDTPPTNLNEVLRKGPIWTVGG